MKIRFIVCLLVVLFAIAWPGNVSAQSLQNLYSITDGVSRSYGEYHGFKIPHGKEVVLAELKGPGKVTYFYVTPASDMVLKVYWDDEVNPSIQCPLGDFFGDMSGKTDHKKVIDYQSIPMQIQHLCYMCYLPMPFSKSARFVLANDSDKDYAAGMAFSVDYEQDQKYTAEKSRLHCLWRRSNPVQDGAAPLDKLIDPKLCGGKNKINTRHTILDVKGRGQYIGNFLRVTTRNKGWWGEGVTFFHLDGKTMVHTAGTEDEYGSCWGFLKTFSYPYCGYLQNQGGTSQMYRWYVTNPVRFQESLKVEIQSLHNFLQGYDDFTSVAFWYQEEPHQPFTLQPFEERTAPSKAVDYNLEAPSSAVPPKKLEP